ncbi:MAG TPA: carboxypeptidase regulatory-like domain-containing protein [Edaphobacter sp.]|nr:carboxypeptidase regulatory-like domain-containing protein [Edaphobacter sp.]
MVHVARRVTVFICFALLSAVHALAQFSSSVQGNVMDSRGAVIGKATVNLTNVETSVTQTKTSDDAGSYRFVSIAPGNYEVSATAAGFTTSKVRFTLRTEENRDVTITLGVGQVTSSVSVTAQAPLLDTSDSRSELTIDTQAIQALPLPGRNPTSLIALAPGVSGLGSAGYNNFFTENADYSANGRGNNGNQYVLDGLDINIDVNPGVLTLVPNADAIAEMSVQTNTYTVDYGKTSSMQTVMTTKSGTDRYHGFASVYYTYQGLNARGEFGPPSSVEIAPFHTTNMSFGVGGPVIPHHQFFFFFSIEPYRALTSNGNSVLTYEDPAFVAFAQQVRPNSPEVQLMTKYKPSAATTTGVAATALDAFGAQDLAANTGCETPSTDNIPCGTAVFDHGNFNSSSFNNSKQYNARVDKYFSKDRVYGALFRDTTNAGGPAVRPVFNTTNPSSVIALQGNETHTFSSNTLNQAFFGYNYLQGSSSTTGLLSVPVVNVNNLGVGWGIGFADGQYAEHNYHWRDVLTHIRGSHSLSFGYEGWQGDDQALFAPSYAQPTFQYNNMIDLINNNPYSESSLSYNPLTGKPMPGQYQYAERTFGLFAQDTWRVTRRVTMNYGLRYDNFGNPYPTAGTPLANFHLGSGATMAEQVANGINKQQKHVYNQDMNWIFSPRAGVAWDVTGSGKWVVRGGYGIYRDWVTLGNAENNLKGNPPGFVLPTFYNNGSTAAPIFGYGTQNTYPFGFPYPAFQGTALDAKGGIPGAQIGVGGVDGNLKSPYTETWSAAVERQVTNNMVASIGYVGQHSGDLQYGGGSSFGNSFSGDVNVFEGDLLKHLSCTPTSPGEPDSCVGTQTRLNSSFGAVNYTFNGPWSNYSALILAVKGRFAQRGFVTASYTRSVSKDNSGALPIGNYPIEYPLSRFYGPSGWDVPNRLSVGWSYQLPALHNGQGFFGRVASGWEISSLTALQSGLPFTAVTSGALSVSEDSLGKVAYQPGSGDFNADGDNNDFPNVTTYHTGNSRKDYIKGVFARCSGTNLDACGNFTLPQLGQEGNERVNQFRNPGFAQVDATFKKLTGITEGIKLDLRLDFFNLFNRVNLTGVNTDAASGSTFGVSTSTQIPRQGQVGARLEF